MDLPGGYQTTILDIIQPDSFSYPPLRDRARQFRLLKVINRDRKSGHIRCHLSTFDWNVDRDIKYTAISYTWDRERRSQTDSGCMIVINDKPLLIRQNVYDLLESIVDNPDSWSKGRPGLMFIDSICIDQSNIIEKNMQVAQMWRIYSRAWRVLIWLGKLPDDLRADLEEIGPHFQDNGSAGDIDGDIDPSEQQARQRLTKSSTTITWIASHPYWKRLWIVQELLLAKLIYLRISHFTVSGSTLFDQWLSLEKFRTGDSPAQDQIVHRLRRREVDIREHRGEMSLGIIEAVISFGNQNCSDVRDRLYGLLALLTSTARRAVKPNYQKSPREVCLDTIMLGISEIDAEVEAHLPYVAVNLGYFDPWEGGRDTIVRMWSARVSDIFGTNFHHGQIPDEFLPSIGPGVLLGRRYLPCMAFVNLGDEGCYICRRRNLYQSTPRSQPSRFLMASK